MSDSDQEEDFQLEDEFHDFEDTDFDPSTLPHISEGEPLPFYDLLNEVAEDIVKCDYAMRLCAPNDGHTIVRCHSSIRLTMRDIINIMIRFSDCQHPTLSNDPREKRQQVVREMEGLLQYAQRVFQQAKSRLDVLVVAYECGTDGQGNAFDHMSTIQIGLRNSGLKGRPKYILPTTWIYTLLQFGYTQINIAAKLRISRETLRVHLRAEDLLPKDRKAFTDDELEWIIYGLRTFMGNAAKMGSMFLQGVLRSRFGIKLSIRKIKEISRRVDPRGAQSRLRRVVKRRVYQVAGPFSLFHIDGWHKLKEYRLVVHGCIDGYTRYILYMICATNNRADTVLQIFVKHVLDTFGMCPSRVRGDYGGENNGVEDLMIELRGVGRGSFIRGGSCNNQRIERTWGDVNAAVGVQFYRTCFFLQQHRVLNPDDEVDLYCLHTTFVPYINYSLKMFVDGFNQHYNRKLQGRPDDILRRFVAQKKVDAGGDIDIHADDDTIAFVDPAAFASTFDRHGQPHLEYEPVTEFLPQAVKETLLTGVDHHPWQLGADEQMRTYCRFREAVRNYLHDNSSL